MAELGFLTMKRNSFHLLQVVLPRFELVVFPSMCPSGQFGNTVSGDYFCCKIILMKVKFIFAH